MRLYMAAARMVGLLLGFGSVSVFALGLGDIALDSALNEPFAAEIPLEAVDASELADLRVALASVDTFKRYGLDRPAYLGNFRFAVSENANGVPVISLSSTEPVSEPFVTLLLDVRWSSGRLLREYTVLLDPPLFENTVVQPAVQVAQTAANPGATAGSGSIDRQSAPPATTFETTEVIEPTGLFQAAAKPESQSVSKPAPAAQRPAPRAAQPEYVAPSSSSSPAPQGDYVTQKGDTLWRIAERSRNGTGLTNNQMMLALYRANPDAFMGNINVLKAGSILRIPAAETVDAPGLAEANAAVREQNAAWSGARSAPAQEARLQLVAPTGTDDNADQGAVATSAGSASGASSADAAQLRDQIGKLEGELSESQRLLQIRDAEMQALQQRIAELEQTAGESGDVALEDGDLSLDAAAGIEAADEIAVDELAEDQIFADEAELADEADQIGDEVATDEVAEEVATDADATDPTKVVTVAEDEPSFLGGLLSNMWLWISAAIALLLAVFLARRRKGDVEEASATGSWAADIEEVSHDDTLKDFGDLPSNQESIVVEEDDRTVIGAADPEATVNDSALDDFSASPEVGALQGIQDDDLDDDNFQKISADDDLDFDLGDDVTFDEVEDALPEQESVGQDEVELPLEKTISTGAPLNLDQADPIAEAEFHMAYGLYDQAAELLGKALENDPENRSYRVKLIEVFFVWENKEGFLEQAHALHDAAGEGGDSDWSKVLILGKQLCPDDELFSGNDATTSFGDSMDLELSEAGETEIDFTLGGSETQALDMDIDFPGDEDSEDDDSENALDFDMGGSSVDEDDEELTLNLGNDDDSVTIESQSSADTLALDSSSLDLDFSDADAVTMESPTLDAEGMDAPTVELDFGDGATMESPTIENPAFNVDEQESDELSDSAATMETPTIESPMSDPTLESPTLDSFRTSEETSEMPALDGLGEADFGDSDEDAGYSDPTSLEVDLSGLADLPIDADDIFDAGDENSPNDGDQAEWPADSSDTGFVGDENRLSPETENIQLSDEDQTLLASDADIGKAAGDSIQGFESGDAPSDTVEQPQIDAAIGDTAEQPALSSDGDVDLSFDDTGIPDDATMTEVGTKLDLARAYIDMGDPDGAKSILNEVLDEGGETQQQQARQLLAELND